jgi:hypothetical protein
MTNSYKKEIDELIAKEKVRREVISETPECKTVKIHSSIDGKRCQVCDKELNPNKIFWYKHDRGITSTNPITHQIEGQTSIRITDFGTCSKKCKNVMIRFCENQDKTIIEKNFDKKNAKSIMKDLNKDKRNIKNLNKKVEKNEHKHQYKSLV